MRAEPIPRLELGTGAGELLVNGRPFLVRGGEINNSSATNPDYLKQFWPKFHDLHLNTLIIPVYWDLIEPQEGHFDFGTIDAAILQARQNRMRLVLLWFGSWKNSQSCYVPGWIKSDPKRFPRALDSNGTRLELLTPFAEANRTADERAYAALLKHLLAFDSTERTVIMIQVENEIGMIPSARDHSGPADLAFASPVPAVLTDLFSSGHEVLAPELKAAWVAAGRRRSGTWSEVFGAGDATEEIFMAWYFAQYTDAVAAAGKHEYPLPTYVNAALIRPGYRPGQYPSAGPLPHLFDVWRAASHSIDLISPDIYFPNFVEWARRYRFPGNPLFIPESLRSSEASVNGLYAFGALDAIGYSAFGIDTIAEPAAGRLAQSFDLVEQLEPFILANRGKGTMAAALSQGPEEKQALRLKLGAWALNVTFERGAPAGLPTGVILPGEAAAPSDMRPSGGIVIATGPDEFIIAGSALVISFDADTPGVASGILSAEEGRYVDGRWKNTLWLGGDQTNQGRQIQLEPGRFSIQRVRLYRY